jgi:hypothetical protein
MKNPQSLLIGGNYKGGISTHRMKNLEKLVNKKFLARRGLKLLRVLFRIILSDPRCFITCMYNPVAKEIMLEKSVTLKMQEWENYKSMPSVYSQLVVG